MVESFTLRSIAVHVPLCPAAVTIAVLCPQGLPRGHADPVELDPAALPVCGAARQGKHCLLRGTGTESRLQSMAL